MKFLATLLIHLSFVAYSGAQIVVTKTDFISKVNSPIIRADYSLLTINANTVYQIDALAAKSGKDQTWDLSVFNFDVSDTSITTILAGTSGAAGADDPQLSVSDYVFKRTKYGNNVNATWDFFTLNDISVHLNGTTKSNNGTLTNKTIYNPPLQPFALPIQYGANWTEAIIDSTITYQGIPIKLHVVVSELVDGEGTLIRTSPIPQTNCLRIKTTQMTTASGLGLTLYDTSYTYTFLNSNDFNLVKLTPKHTASNSLLSQLNVNPNVTETSPVVLSAVKDIQSNAPFAMQNSPNPFSTKTKINYYLSNRSHVKIIIHDMLGKEIGILSDEITEPGNHSANFDASGIPSGCYYYTIETKSSSYTKQMMITH